MEKLELPKETIDALDPGIRDLVIALNDAGFQTTDSGDGVSKAEDIENEDALPWAHVSIRVHPEDMIEEADRLSEWMLTWSENDDRFIDCQIEATYFPRVDLGIIVVSDARGIYDAYVDDRSD